VTPVTVRIEIDYDGMRVRRVVSSPWPTVAIAVRCPCCGAGLQFEVPAEVESDAVCESCGARIGRMVRL